MYTAVQDFHRAFGHPVADMPAPLSRPRLETRVTWMCDELFEFRAERWVIHQIDALEDFLVFAAGTLVEITPDVPRIETPAYSRPRNVAGIPDKECTRVCEDLTRRLLPVLRHSTAQGQVSSVIPLMLRAIEILEAQIGVDALAFFQIVMASNMSKLWPDGTPRYNDEGKILKPPSFVPPETRIEQELNKVWAQIA